MYAASAMELEPTAVTLGSAQLEAATETSQNATDIEINQLFSQVRMLSGKAEEIEAQAKRLEMECGGDEDALDDARRAADQAQSMRGMAQQISQELTSAPTDRRSGKKSISANRIAQLSGIVDHIVHAADKEKGELNDAMSEAKTHTYTTKAAITATKSAAVEKPGIITRVVQKAKTIAAPTVVASEIQKADTVTSTLRKLHEVKEQITREVATLNASISETFEAAKQTVVVSTKKAIETAKTFITSSVETAQTAVSTHVVEPAKRLADKVVAKTIEAGTAVKTAASRAVDKVSTAASDAKHWMVTQVEEKKNWVVAKLPFGKKEEAKPPVAQAKAPELGMLDQMTTAARQKAVAAMAGITALVQDAQSLTQKLEFSAPILPKINLTIMHLPSLN